MRTSLILTTTIAMGCVMDVDVDVNPQSTSDASTTSDGSTSLPPAMTTTVDPDDGSSSDSRGESSSGEASSTGPMGSSESSESTTGEPPKDGPAYDDCANEPGCNLAEEACIFDGVRGVCASQGCSDVSDCPALELPGPVPAHPTPAVVACVDVTGDGVGECILDCTEGLTAGCPEGMTAVSANGQAICMWPTLPAGGGQCPDEDLGALLGEYIGNVMGSIDDRYPLCSFGGGEDALLAWVAPSDGAFRFSTEGSSFDTVIALLDACGGTEIACGNNQVGTFGVVTREFVAGESVIVVVDSHAGNVGLGEFTLTISQI